MRSLLAAIAILYLLPGSLAAAQAEGQLYTASREQLDVTKVVLAQEAEWNKGDLDGYLFHFKDAKDTEAVLNGPVRGLDNIRAAYHSSFPSKEAMGTLEQREVTVRELGPDFALATGKYHLGRTKKNGGDAEGTFTEIFEKVGKSWQLIFSQAT
ncbi:MAG: YybH family protein [Janthinobacterium lividum]